VTTLVLVHTDTGHVGVGSAYAHPGLVTHIIKGQLEPPLKGHDPREVEYLWGRMYDLTRWYGRKGAAVTALGALDTAFWDLRGQALGKPVWALLGGQRACPAYASALLWKDGVQGFRELLRAKAVDIVQPDASRCGGITEVVRVARLAADAGLPFAPHTWSDAVAVLANAHVVASHANGLTVEVDQTGNPFIDDLLEEPLRVRDGTLTLSDRPGLGITLNQSILDRYRLLDPGMLLDGFYSDMAFGPGAFAPGPAYLEKP
jgi:L-alanine-DL-glutamate epimerase-like enolase superfamily enzyme